MLVPFITWTFGARWKIISIPRATVTFRFPPNWSSAVRHCVILRLIVTHIRSMLVNASAHTLLTLPCDGETKVRVRRNVRWFQPSNACVADLYENTHLIFPSRTTILFETNQNWSEKDRLRERENLKIEFFVSISKSFFFFVPSYFNCFDSISIATMRPFDAVLNEKSRLNYKIKLCCCR